MASVESFLSSYLWKLGTSCNLDKPQSFGLYNGYSGSLNNVISFNVMWL